MMEQIFSAKNATLIVKHVMEPNRITVLRVTQILDVQLTQVKNVHVKMAFLKLRIMQCAKSAIFHAKHVEEAKLIKIV
jgi:hypothetical protein